MRHCLIKAWVEHIAFEGETVVLLVPLTGELAAQIEAGRSLVLAADDGNPRPDHAAFNFPLPGLYVSPELAPPDDPPGCQAEDAGFLDEILDDELVGVCKVLDAEPPIMPNLDIETSYLEVGDDWLSFRGTTRGDLDFETALVPLAALAAAPAPGDPRAT